MYYTVQQHQPHILQCTATPGTFTTMQCTATPGTCTTLYGHTRYIYYIVQAHQAHVLYYTGQSHQSHLLYYTVQPNQAHVLNFIVQPHQSHVLYYTVQPHQAKVYQTRLSSSWFEPKSLSWAGLGRNLNIQAWLGSGSKGFRISKLNMAWPWKEVGFSSWALLRL